MRDVILVLMLVAVILIIINLIIMTWRNLG